MLPPKYKPGDLIEVYNRVKHTWKDCEVIRYLPEDNEYLIKMGGWMRKWVKPDDLGETYLNLCMRRFKENRYFGPFAISTTYKRHFK